MTGPAAFPPVDTGALDDCAAGLQRVSGGISGTSTNVLVLRDAVDSSEQWKGDAASRWQAVITDRVRDASLTGEVLAKAGSLLSQLAADIAAERAVYNKASGQMSDAGAAFNPRFSPAPPDWDSSYIAVMNAAAARTTELLRRAGNDFLVLAGLAGDIDATTAASRTPGVPPGASRNEASLSLLAFLFGSVTGNQTAGAKFEAQVLSELGLTKNTVPYRPDPAFEGRLTAGGLAKGTIPDAQGSGYLVEIKDTTKMSARFQIRLEEAYASETGRPLWIVVRQGTKVSPDVIGRAEGTGGGVLYRTAPGSYQDGDGNPVQVGPNMQVHGYQRAGMAPAPQEPEAPVAPAPADPAPAVPAEPVEPAGPADPIEIP